MPYIRTAVVSAVAEVYGIPENQITDETRLGERYAEVVAQVGRTMQEEFRGGSPESTVGELTRDYRWSRLT